MNAPMQHDATVFETLKSQSLPQIRQAVRHGHWTGHTSGLANERVQGNVCILPADIAHDFLLFCQRNPKPCPLLYVSEPGQTSLPALGVEIDIRTDVPRYRVWRDGQLVQEPIDIKQWWRSDLVTFVIGCSFSFEWALMAQGIVLRHVEQGLNVAMYRTNRACESAGRFAGPMVVSMRPLRAADAIRAIQITSAFPNVHGAPIHIGDPALIGIKDLQSPDYGDAVHIKSDEIPVFWACGVTPQAIVAASSPEFCITHAPGAMLITDLYNARLAS